MKNNDFTRLLELKGLIDSSRASPQQKKEYIEILYKNGNITKEQYDSYLNNQNAEDIINAALTIGGVIIVVWLLSKLFD